MNEIRDYEKTILNYFKLFGVKDAKIYYEDHTLFLSSGDVTLRIRVDRYYADVTVDFLHLSGKSISLFELMEQKFEDDQVLLDASERKECKKSVDSIEEVIVSYMILIRKYFLSVVTGEYFKIKGSEFNQRVRVPIKGSEFLKSLTGL